MTPARSAKLLLITIATLLWGVSLRAQSLQAGDYNGRLGPLSLVLHLARSDEGALSCTLDSPNQGALGIPCGDLRLEGNALSFRVPSVNGNWKGTVSEDGTTLTGSWSQGTPMPLIFTRNTFVAAAQPSPVDGIWLGSFADPSQPLRGQLILQSGNRGELLCTLDVIEQEAFDIGCTEARFSNGQLSFAVPMVDGRWTGRLAEDGALKGTWTQRNAATGAQMAPAALDFARQSQRIERPLPPPATFDAAIAPVTATQLETVLREDLKTTLTTGVLAPGKGIGVTIGVVTRGERRVFALGEAKPEALFEIGSITKTFTGLLMAQLIEQGKVQPATPVRTLLPEGTVTKPEGAEITLLDLVTQHSGLPRMPTNFQPRDPANPYADYDAARLHAFMSAHGVAKPADAGFLYSNVGLGLLGDVLARAGDQPYPALLAAQVLQPLGLSDTAIDLGTAQSARFITGHAPNLAPAHSWEIDALAGAGALRSTADDMLRYVEANLDPDNVKATGDAARTLPAALKRSQQPLVDAIAGTRIAYAWLHDEANNTWWHNGGTGGFTSFAFFNPQEGYAGVVLVNLAMSGRGSLADLIGQHIGQRLTGKPAISLAHW